jgi:tetratricopeptide (TPR) repeat protein
MKTTSVHALLALLIACLLLPLSIFAAESGVSQTEFQAYKKDAQVKLDETKDSLPAKVKERMDERVAGALINIGIELDKSGDCEEALESYDEVLKRLDKTNEPVLLEQIANARHAKSTGLLRRAKENWPDEGNRSDALRAALALLEQSEENFHDKPRCWGTQSYVTFLLGQPDKARSLLKRSLQQSLQPPPQTTTLPSVPPDEDFLVMSNAVWAEVQNAA